MSIAKRLIILLAVPLLSLIAVAAFTLTTLYHIEDRAERAAVLQAKSLAALGNISRSQAEMRVNVRSCVLAETPEDRSAALELFNNDRVEAEGLLAAYSDTLISDEKDGRLTVEYTDKLKRWEDVAQEVCALAASDRRADAVSLLQTTGAELGASLTEVSREWIAHNETLAREYGQEAMGAIDRAKRLALIAGIAAMVVSAFVGLVILRSIVRPLAGLQHAVETIAKGDYQRPVPFTAARDETGSLARSISVLKDGAAAMERQRAVKLAAAGLATELQGAETIEEFGKRLLGTLTSLLGGGVSAFYHFEPETGELRRAAGYGMAAGADGEAIVPGQGLVGQCVVERRAVMLNGLPPSYLRVTSGLGSAPPTHAGAWPLIAGEELSGVFEHASFNALTAEQAAMLDELLSVAAMNLEILLRNVRTRELLGKTTEQATALRAQQETLKASEEQFRTLLEAAPDALIICDEDGRMVMVNAQTERLLGYSRGELIGQAVEMLVPERVRARHPGMRRSYHSDSGVRPMGIGMELSAVRKDGSEFPVEISLSPLRTPEGESWVCSSLRDITERKKAEIELKQAKEKAEEATKAKSAFLANMSHEIRTPMNGVIGMTELALDTDLTAEQRDYLNTVKSSADALLSIINDILDFSKIEAGKIELDPIEFLLRDSISDTLNPLALRASSKNVELAYEVASDVPDALVGDVYRLRQVMVNLVGNAIKFTQKGEVVVGVSLAERRGDDVVLRMTVRDTGIGISPEAAARLFKPFEQAEASTTRKFGGTGLGLAIARQLVQLMGGTIALESTPGVGSTFSFTFAMKVGVHRSPVEADDAARLLREKVALIVDDNETNRRILEAMLANWGLQTMSADGGAAALAILDRTESAGRPISLLISDLHMPEMDGFELVSAVRSRERTAALPVIMLTSSASPGDQAQSEHLKVAARLIKPVKQSLLLDNIVRVMSGAERRGAVDAAQTSVAERASATKNLRVLLAEDNAVNQKFAVRVLEGAGHVVVVAHNGREAVEKWATEAFDVVLMDVQMPELDGLEATRQIREREGASGKRMPIIAMTANAMAGDREMCLSAGMDGYVAKPVKKDLLFNEISRVLEGAGHAADHV